VEQRARDSSSQSGGDELIKNELLDQGCGLALGRYTLLRKIAVGGMAEVYVARSQGVSGFAKKVALKRILPQHSHNRRFIEMLLDEAKISVSLTHPNIAQVYELGLGAQDTHFIVMEYVEGRPLNRVLQRALERGQPGLPITHAVHVMSEVAKGLDHAHKQTNSKGELLQIVHRDISPQNVLLSYQGSVKLIDFGIARAQGRAAQTGHGIIKGKLRFLAPEIAAGKEPDHRADIFCCGLVLFELLTGEAMYSPTNDIHALEMARRAQVRSPRSMNRAVPEDLDAIVMKMLRRDRNERYSSAKDLYADLRMFLNRYDPLFNEGELADYMQSMFKIEMVEARDLDGFAEKIAFNENRHAEEPTVSLEAWDLLPKDEPMGGRPQKLHLVGADGGAAMSVVLETDDKSEAPLVGEAPGPRTMPRASLAQPAAGTQLGKAELPAATSRSSPAEELRATMPEPDLDDEDSLSGDLVAELPEVIPARKELPELVQAPTATIELDEAVRLGLVAPPSENADDTVDREGNPLEVTFREGGQRDSGQRIGGSKIAAAHPKATFAPQLLTGSAMLAKVEPKGPRGIVLFLGATAIVFVACLLLSFLLGADPASQVAIAQPVVIEPEKVAYTLSEPVAPAVELIAEEPPAETNEERVRLKSFEETSETSLEAPVEEGTEAPGIVVEDPEPGDEEPDRERDDRPKRARGGTMLINSRPVSTIYVDGERIGRTPKVVTLKPGKHEISLEGPNGQQKSFSKKIAAGKNPAITWRWR
jgi:serine/threonine protein kinase